MKANVKNTKEVGRNVPRLEARAKVTGQAEYIHHLVLPGMLHGKIARSTLAHGRILSIDTSAALAVPGVHSVITGEDLRRVCREPYFGPAFHDQPALALDKVRYVGEPVALVLAEDPHVAANAAQLVEVQYEELPAVFDELEAMDGKVVVHEVLKPAGTFADLKHLVDKRDTNIALDYHLKRGDVAAGFEKAEHVFEHTFRTQQVMHTPLEPMVSAAHAQRDHMTIWTASQSPSFVRLEIARLLGWRENQVRVKVAHLGGGFGAKLYIKLEALVALASLLAERPVKVALTMEEQFYHITKHPTTFRIKSGVDSNGKLLARRCDVWWNGGAYADIGPRVTQKSGFTAPGPYEIDNVEIESYALYTNRPPAGALRGFGIPQLVWAYESHTDMIARALKMDPLEMRRRNILREGRPQATGTLMHCAEIEAVLERVAASMQWEKPFEQRGSGPLKRGRGLAVGFKAVVAPTTSTATVTLAADGSCTLAMATVDMGQGSDTAMAQCAAEILGIRTEDVRVLNPDTDITPYDMATLGSRSTYHMGNAVRLAAQDALAKLRELAEQAGMGPDYAGPFGEVFVRRYGMQAGSVVGFGAFVPPYKAPDKKDGQSDNVTPFWMIGGTGVEVTVDTETGHVTIDRMVNAVDCGTPLNPAIVETQLSGAAIMQLGFTLFEKMELDNGQVTNASLADYKIPGFHDIPPKIENLIVAAEQEHGPFGAKGVGESATFGLSPAVANAIEDAVGVRLTELPMTPEMVLRALRRNQDQPLED